MRSPILSTISLASGLALTGCSGGDTSCGTQGGFEFGLVASSDAVNLTYGDLVASSNNDCPDPAAPAGVVSLTITGMEMGTTGIVTFCVPRPDELETTPQPLGLTSGVEVIDFSGADDACSYSLDPTTAPQGTVSSKGMCGDGSDSAGFDLDFDATLTLDAECGGSASTIMVDLTGDVSVAAGD